MITKMLYQPVKGTYKFKQSHQPSSYHNHLENVPKGNKPTFMEKATNDWTNCKKVG